METATATQIDASYQGAVVSEWPPAERVSGKKNGQEKRYWLCCANIKLKQSSELTDAEEKKFSER